MSFRLRKAEQAPKAVSFIGAEGVALQSSDDEDELHLSQSIQFMDSDSDDDEEEQKPLIVGGSGGAGPEDRLALLEENANANLASIAKLKKENKNLKQANIQLQKLLKKKDNSDKRREKRTQMMINRASQKADTKFMRTLSEDVYSFLFCSPLISIPSLIAMSTIFLQYFIFSLFFADMILTQSIPANVEIIVRIAQLVAILVTFAAQTDVRTSLRSLIYKEGFREMKDAFENFTVRRFVLANILMFCQGMLGVVVTLILIIYTDNVFDLLLNFTAVMFVSELDELVFYMARQGYLGRPTETLAKDIEETEYPQTDLEGFSGSLHVYVFLTLMIAGYGYFFYTANLQYDHWSLPKIVKAEFGDNFDASLGLYSGCYQMVPKDGWEDRVDYIQGQPGRGQGMFAYCPGEIRSWTFTPLSFIGEGEKVCDIAYLASTEEHPTSFDLMDAKVDQWKFNTGNPLSDFQLVEVVEEDHIEKECGDAFLTSDANLCPILTIGPDKEGFTGDRDWSRDFEVLILNDNETASFYQHPVYIGEAVDPVEGVELVFFTGRRWLLVSAKNLLMEDDTTKPEYNATKLLTDPDYVYGLLTGGEDDDSALRLLSRPIGAYAFISEAIDQGSDTGTPLGLRWYHTRYADNAGVMFPSADISRPIDALFTCGKCNSLTNPCRFEGVCRDDGTCECKHGATGKLCEIKPLANGECNVYFNRRPDHYDGGDCCVSTCEGVSCGVGDVLSAFGQNLTRSGNGYPHCADPEMVPFSIVMNHTINTTFFTGIEDGAGGDFESFVLEVRCDDGKELPIRVNLDPQITGEASQTLYVADRTENCFVSFFGIQSLSQFNATIQLIDGIPGSGGALMSEEHNITVDSTYAIPSLYARCLKDTLKDVLETPVLYSGSYQDKALFWLNQEIENGECINTEEWLTQRYALVAMYESEGEPVGAVDRNDHCLWSRITCKDSNPVVITHDGGTTGALKGFLATEIGLLTHLERFDVFKNELTGTIPSEIGLLTKMTSLGFSETPTIGGTIPTTLGQLTSLESLLLWKNSHTGTIPTEIGLLGDSLKMINLQENLLTGGLPSEFGLLTNLERITLHTNQFSGPLPSEIGEMTSLTNMVISRMRPGFSGTLPDFTKLSNLDTLIFFENKLTGTLPTKGIENLTALYTLNLSTNKLTGSIPAEWESLSTLYWLIMNKNKLTGTVPDYLGSFPDLSRLALDANKLVGSIPDSFANMSNMSRLRIQKNDLTGEIKPEVMGGWTSMGQLYLSRNNFNGTLPSTIGNLAGMDYFECHSNNLEGSLPSELYQITKLYGLYVHKNRFSGTISEDIGNLSNLWFLDMSDNQLSGTIPSTIGLLTNLNYLKVLGGNNSFNGTVPAEVCAVLIGNNATSDLMDACKNGTPL